MSVWFTRIRCMSLEVSLLGCIASQRVSPEAILFISALKGSTGSAMNDLHELSFPTISEENIATDSLAAPDYSSELVEWFIPVYAVTT